MFVKYLSRLCAAIFLLLMLAPVTVFSQVAGADPARGGYFTRIDSITLSGNKITRDPILYREIVFQAGDYIRLDKLDSLLDCSQTNLMNTLLFNFVYVDKKFVKSDSSAVNINVSVVERWYVWPVPVLKISDRNFNVWWQTKDFSRLSYGFYVDWNNFRGRREHLIMKFQWGYERLVQLRYRIPYLNREKTIGMEFNFVYGRQKETAYRTLYNKQEFLKEEDGFVRQDYGASSQLIIRKKIYNSHYLELGYSRHQFSDSLIRANENFGPDTSGLVQYLLVSYTFKSDHRDFKSYPLKGHYFDFTFEKDGLWTFNAHTVNTLFVLATFRKYWQFHPRFYFASGLNGQFTLGKQPYFILRGIGYDRDIIRSYEYYLVDSRHFGIWKNNLKFAIIPNTVKRISFIRTDKFAKIYYALYLNLFCDLGYGAYKQDFGRETNDLQNSLLLGYGAGVDFVTYYDIVLRLEFALNLMGEPGLFLHFRAPI